jgi:hypothetical protein
MAGSAVALARQLKGARQRVRVQAEMAERRLTIGAIAAGVGFLEKRGTIPTAIGNIPTKLAGGIALSVLETQATGSTRRLASAGADALLAIYSYAAGKAGAFIAGDADGDDL